MASDAEVHAEVDETHGDTGDADIENGGPHPEQEGGPEKDEDDRRHQDDELDPHQRIAPRRDIGMCGAGQMHGLQQRDTQRQIGDQRQDRRQIHPPRHPRLPLLAQFTAEVEGGGSRHHHAEIRHVSPLCQGRPQQQRQTGLESIQRRQGQKQPDEIEPGGQQAHDEDAAKVAAAGDRLVLPS